MASRLENWLNGQSYRIRRKRCLSLFDYLVGIWVIAIVGDRPLPTHLNPDLIVRIPLAIVLCLVFIILYPLVYLCETPTRFSSRLCLNGLDSLKDIDFRGVIEFSAWNGTVDSLLDERGQSLLPEGLKVLQLSDNQLTSLKGVPQSVTHLDVSGNAITCLEGLPSGLNSLNIQNNRLRSLVGLPFSVSQLYCEGNPLGKPYRRCRTQDQFLRRAKEKNSRYRDWEAGKIIRRFYRDRSARIIQRRWRRYWMEPYSDPRYDFLVSRYMICHANELDGRVESAAR